MSKSPHPGNIFLENVPWQDLETILFKRQKNGETLLAYDNGRLELITPSPLHQEYRELLEEFLIALFDLYNINYRGLGLALWQRPDLKISLEVDSCFYIQNLPAIEKILTISLLIDQKDDELNLRVIGGDGICNVLHQNCLT
ncbi:MAG: hypothetical protein ACKPH7_05435, partial [Planktothrix sp.]